MKPIQYISVTFEYYLFWFISGIASYVVLLQNKVSKTLKRQGGVDINLGQVHNNACNEYIYIFTFVRVF